MLGFLPLTLSDSICSLARSAKERKVRIWKDYVAPTANLDQKDRQFVAKVSPQSGLSPLRSLFSFRYELASFRSTLTTVSQVTENSTRTFLIGKKIKVPS